MAGMGGRGKGPTFGGVYFQGGPISPDSSDDDMQTPDVGAERLAHLEEVRRRGNVSHRDRATRAFIQEHGHEPWRRPRGRGRVTHDGAGSSAGPTGPVNQYHQQFYGSPHYHQEFYGTPHQEQPEQDYHSPIQEMRPEGPLLTDFERHICRDILADPTLEKTLVSHNHGSKIGRHLGPYTERLLERVMQSQLQPLLETYHTTCDNALLTAFVERWHSDTMSFHLPFGEMTVTLHDISNLLHLPIMGTYPSAETVSVDRAIELAMENFGVTYAEAFQNTVLGPYYLFSWLLELLKHHMEEDGDEDIALKIYLLLLLSYSIFTSKTSNRADAKLLLMLSDLRRAGDLAWGVGALVHLYNELSYSSLRTTKNLSGFPALLQAWIMWYFPRVWKRKVGVAGSAALGGQWTKRKTNQTVVECRRIVDQLTTDDVCWQPFQGQENGRALEFFSLFRGWLKWGDLTVPYMPDRCFRQFGYVQSIPHCPLRAPYPSHRDIMRAIAGFMNVVTHLVASATVTTYDAEVAEGYLQWYATNSYPRLMGDLAEPQEDEEEQQQHHHHFTGEEHQQHAQHHQPPQWDEPPPTDGAPVPPHLPQWVHQLVDAVREGLHGGDIRPRTRTWGRTYAIVGTYPDPPPQAQTRRDRGTRRQ